MEQPPPADEKFTARAKVILPEETDRDMQILRLLLLTFLLLAATGCPPNSPAPQLGGKVTRPPKQPPAYPPSQPVPLDPELQAAARRELTAGLRSADTLTRVHALEGIRSAKVAGHDEDVLRALNDPELAVRFAAALDAGEMGLKQALPDLQRMAEDHSEKVRVAVRSALHKLGMRASVTTSST